MAKLKSLPASGSQITPPTLFKVAKAGVAMAAAVASARSDFLTNFMIELLLGLKLVGPNEPACRCISTERARFGIEFVSD